MPYVESSIVIKGDVREIYELAKDMESYPQYMPDVESVKVLSRENNTTVTDWVTSVEGTPFLWQELDEFDDDNCRISYRLIEGDLDKFEGEWIFEPVEGGTKVTLTVDYDFGIPELTKLIGPTLQQKVKENSEMMLEAMKKRIEQNAKA